VKLSLGLVVPELELVLELDLALVAHLVGLLVANLAEAKIACPAHLKMV
jgi:hypothetical protein